MLLVPGTWLCDRNAGLKKNQGRGSGRACVPREETKPSGKYSGAVRSQTITATAQRPGGGTWWNRQGKPTGHTGPCGVYCLPVTQFILDVW